MNNNDTTLLQKIKDNAFYVALGVGIIAILAVIAVYSMQRGGTSYDDSSVDLNQASDYSSITTENTRDSRRDSTTGSTVTKNTKRRSNNEAEVANDTVDTSDNNTSYKTSEEIARRQATIGKNDSTTEVVDDGEQLPVTADIGELDFGSDKTLEWPVSGDVILPYSMETTVYYKTLDQYQTNPGMLIAAGSGSTVQNAYLGKVVKVTSDNTYGNMVTLYIGNDYSIVYGQLDTIYVKEGDYVKAGESIGTIGKPTDSFEEEGSHLFFQILKGDTPVDPMGFME